ncbi:hypothetical protein [Bradyrhizobium sp.]|nr:hypothetical protein [Bradyrhizobium sp.]
MSRDHARWRARKAIASVLLLLLAVTILVDVFVRRRSARSLPS